MGDKSKIEWTDATWTPIRARRHDNGKVGVHCERVSEACKNCYAERLNLRNLPAHGTGLEFTVLNRPKVEIFVDEEMLLQPLRWKRSRRIFVCSQTDLFAEFVTDEMIDRVFAVMALCPQHTFQVLTKRPKRMLAWSQSIEDNEGGRLRGECFRDCMIEGQAQNIYSKLHPASDPSEWLAVHQPLPNVWLGVTAENQARAEERIPVLLRTPAALRFLSVEPMLGPINLWASGMKLNGKLNYHTGERAFIRQVICGGESGPGARPMHPDWARSLRDQCQAAGVPFFFKQWGEWTPGENVNRRSGIVPTATWWDESWMFSDENFARCDGHRDDQPDLYRVGKRAAGRHLDGREWSEFPEVSGGR